MLENIFKVIGPDNFFILDWSLHGLPGEKNILKRIRSNSEYTKYSSPEFITIEATKVDEMTRFLYLAERALVLEETILECKDLREAIRKSIEICCNHGQSNPLSSQEKINLAHLRNYTEILSRFENSARYRDPRKIPFLFEDESRIDEQDPIYHSILAKTKLKLEETLLARGKTPSENGHFTDAHIFTVAHFLERKGYNTCIVTADSDFYTLAKRFRDGSKVISINGKYSGGFEIWLPNTDYRIKIFNPTKILDQPQLVV